MTGKVFWENPYLCDLETRVSEVEGPDSTLEKMIFYAFCDCKECIEITLSA
jgi:hypothetical protein